MKKNFSWTFAVPRKRTISCTGSKALDKLEFTEYLDWRRRLVLVLVLLHFCAVLVFDILAIYFPGVLNAKVSPGSPLTLGIVFAILIVISVIFSAFYYSHRVNRRDISMPGQE